MQTERDGFAVLNYRGTWFPSNARFNQEALPASLRDAVVQGSSGTQRFEFGGTPYVAVGVYIAEMDAAYFEVFSMAEPPAHPERDPHVAADRLGHRHRRRRRPSAPTPAAGCSAR